MNSTAQLAEAVEHALRAPSVHNTQPWRWLVDGTDGVVELYADLNRHLTATDPDRRDLLISCGAALDHLVVAVVRGSAPRIAPPRNGPVVVGVDGSAAGTAALGFGADLAASLGARLLAVRCWSEIYATPERSAHRSHRTPEALAAAAAVELDEQLRPITAGYPDLTVERKLVDAPPLQALTECAAGARVLVVGTRGHLDQSGVLMGSTSQALVEFATCPVVVVHPRRAVGAAAGPAAMSRTS